MPDIFESRVANAHKVLSEQYAAMIDVPPERRFVGFDAWQKAIDYLRPGDVAMLTGYAGFRPKQNMCLKPRRKTWPSLIAGEA